MSNKRPARVRKPGTDPRIRRSTQALGQALIELIQERRFDGITVQQILDRAGVGRATFYAHYRNREDVLASSYERVFSAFDSILDNAAPTDTRLFPVAEFLTHVGSTRGLLAALQRDGRLADMWQLFVGYSTRMIEHRLSRGAHRPPAGSPRLSARMLAGALAEAIRWWQEHPTSATPTEIDAGFHALAHHISPKNVKSSARSSLTG